MPTSITNELLVVKELVRKKAEGVVVIRALYSGESAWGFGDSENLAEMLHCFEHSGTSSEQVAFVEKVGVDSVVGVPSFATRKLSFEVDIIIIVAAIRYNQFENIEIVVRAET